jgi:hypothetical protein
MNTSISIPKPVSLKQVAAWELEYLNAPCEIKASVPALQRGLVWRPQQVELLWDSILRGFPIGSLVVSEKVDKQERSRKSDITHHLLDGQQRCNAIALGFYDPFDSTSQFEHNKSGSILWLDLAPQGISKNLSSQLRLNSTREFLTRITTFAHPWGYQTDDDASRLIAHDVREAVKKEYGTKVQPGFRPKPVDLRPYKSNAPVPLSWLMQAIDSGKGELRNAQQFWDIIKHRLEQESTTRRWPTLAFEVLGHDLNTIYLGICRAVQTELIVMKTPKDILSPTRRERSNPNENDTNIASIEHLFNRLNRQGTPLNSEELAYSMIKAYWPEIADEIDKVASCRIPASQLVSLGVRAALTERGSKKLARAVGIPRLRSIAKATQPLNEQRLKGVGELIQFLVRYAKSQACFTPLGEGALNPAQNLVRPHP